MPEETDPTLRRLRAAIEQSIDERLPGLLAEAQRDAEARVKAVLTDAMSDALLERAAEVLAPPPPAPAPRPASRPAPATRPVGEGFGLYVYCVVGADIDALPRGLRSLDPAHPPRLMVQGALAAVVSHVPLADFGEEQLRAHLSDVAWLEAAARTHEDVLEAINDETTLVPMRLCTIYRGESGVREMLLREHDSLANALSQLHGKTEWGVKLFACADAPPSGATGSPPTDSPGVTAPSSGIDYMRGRLDEREQRDRQLDELQERCMTIHDRLSGISADSHLIAPQRRDVTGREGEMLLNGVYLVEDEQLTRFFALVEALRAEHHDHGIDVEATGPWPAYNFVPGTIGAAW